VVRRVSGSPDAAIAAVESAVEDEPAQLVPAPLIVEHELADLCGESIALPRALDASRLPTAILWSRSADGSDRIGGGPELVGRDMRDCR
jgi:hypothetical protein